MYYNMRMKTIHRNVADLRNRLTMECEDLLKGIYGRLRTLMFSVKEVRGISERVKIVKVNFCIKQKRRAFLSQA